MRKTSRVTGAIKRITVFTGSASGVSPTYAEAAVSFGTTMAKAGVGIVFGGGNIGLMGVLADAAMAAGGEVIGVIPEALLAREVAHHGITQLDVVPDMHVRKMRMATYGDAFVAMPGGIGTLEELFEAWTWLQLGIHIKPVALLDVDGFWTSLLVMLDAMVAEGFVSERFRQSLIVRERADDLLDALRDWTPPEVSRTGAKV